VAIPELTEAFESGYYYSAISLIDGDAFHLMDIQNTILLLFGTMPLLIGVNLYYEKI